MLKNVKITFPYLENSNFAQQAYSALAYKSPVIFRYKKMGTQEEKPYINYVKEAFALPSNLAFLGVMSLVTITTFILAAAELLPFLPEPGLLVTALILGTSALEMAFLSLMPESERFKKAVNAKYENEYRGVEDRLQSMQMMTELGGHFLERYLGFYQKKLAIMENIERNPSVNDAYTYTYLDKLNQLESNYVRLLHGIERYQRSKDVVARPHLEEEIQNLIGKMKGSEGKLREEYEKRIKVLLKRQQRGDKSKVDLEIAGIQIDTIEDTLDYIMEQSLTLKNPEEVSRMVDSIIHEAENHRSTLEELEALTADYLADDDFNRAAGGNLTR